MEFWYSFLAENLNQDKSQVFFRYTMNGRSWGHFVHPVPFDKKAQSCYKLSFSMSVSQEEIPYQLFSKDFSIGIEKYSNGMVLITNPGIYQVSAMLSDNTRLRIKKNSDLYAYTYNG